MITTDLIEKLKLMPPDAEVRTVMQEGRLSTIGDVEFVRDATSLQIGSVVLFTTMKAVQLKTK
jgi:hypothetical protein